MPGRHPNANANQRARRGRRPRIDYYPSPDAQTAIDARRTRYGPTNNHSGILDAIVAEWLVPTGRAHGTAVPDSEGTTPEFREQNARARVTSVDGLVIAPEVVRQSRARARARTSSVPENRMEHARVVCGARRRRDDQPCQALSVPGKRRCKWHGGCSTGPRTADGRARALANLCQHADKAKRSADNLIAL